MMAIVFGVAGIVVGAVVCWLTIRQLPKSEPNLVTTLDIKDMTELVEKISEGYVRGIRSVLGLDLAGEVIEQQADDEDLPISPVNQLEMDPFMGEDMEWLTPIPPNNGNEE